MSNKTFKRIMLICFVIIVGSIGACVGGYYVLDTGHKVESIADKYFKATSVVEDGDRALIIDIPYADGLTEKMILEGARSICYEIQSRNIKINKNMLILNVYNYEDFKRTDLYTMKIQDIILYSTDWLSITKYDELRTLIKR